MYIDDMPRTTTELSGSFVVSTRAHAKIISIDSSAALAMPGVHSFVSAKDVPGLNSFGPAVPDDHVFADGVVRCIGYPVGMILADTHVRTHRFPEYNPYNTRNMHALLLALLSSSTRTFRPYFLSSKQSRLNRFSASEKSKKEIGRPALKALTMLLKAKCALVAKSTFILKPKQRCVFQSPSRGKLMSLHHPKTLAAHKQTLLGFLELTIAVSTPASSV